MVLGAGLEPARSYPHAPQACVSANFTTRAGDQTVHSISHLIRYAQGGVSKKKFPSRREYPRVVPSLA